ncbi:response regulator [Halofilum ochraceum]|uniref:response regulator n=1 Tax=Halofilum ochraceum TaxID=1611323 RepID=UPI0008D9E8F8|nr:response regulator [Halofilum ochraceum]
MSNVKTILLVEDNTDDEELARVALEESRIANEVVIARDGADALECLGLEPSDGDRAMNPLPAVVLLDLKLPKLDGMEVLRRIRGDERTRLLPVVVLTSSSEEEDIVDSYGLGANSYMRKPVDFDQFHDMVKQFGMYWLLLNEVPYGR